MSTEVKVPDIGDFKDVPVIEVHVKPGQVVKAEDTLITLESDKATNSANVGWQRAISLDRARAWPVCETEVELVDGEPASGSACAATHPRVLATLAGSHCTTNSQHEECWSTHDATAILSPAAIDMVALSWIRNSSVTLCHEFLRRGLVYCARWFSRAG